MNAVKHGLSAETLVLPTEKKEDYESLRERLLADLLPEGALEQECAEGIVKYTWRLNRAVNLEEGILACGVSTADEEFLTRQRKKYCEVTEADFRRVQLADKGFFDADHVHEVVNTRLHEDLSMAIDDAVSIRRTDQGRLAAAFIDDASGPNALSKLDRHETSLFRKRNELIKTLAELQASRRATEKGEAE